MEPKFNIEDSTADRFSFENCMPFIHATRKEGDVPPSLMFVQSVSQAIFSCEYFQGRPLRRYGNFGPRLKMKGRDVYAGWGYAITDKDNDFEGLLNTQDFTTFYRDLGNVRLHVNEGPLAVSGYGKALRTFFVEADGKYVFGTKTVAALGMLTFYKNKVGYRLFLWVQDHSLTRDEISKRFSDMMRLIVVPSTSIAEMKE